MVSLLLTFAYTVINEIVMKKIVIALMASALMFSCETPDPEDEIEESVDTTTEQDNARLEKEWNSLDNTVNTIINDEFGTESSKRMTKTTKTTDCYDATLDLTSTPYELTIKFKGASCFFDGRTRTGTLNITFNGAYKDEGTKITTTTTDYVVDGYEVSGTKVVLNEGQLSNGSIKYKVTVSNGSVTDSEGDNVASWITSTRYRIWTEGYDTPNLFSDDEYEIYGEADGVDRNGDTFTFEVPSFDPLAFEYQCWRKTRLPLSGTLTIRPEGKKDRIVNYGNGTCDTEVQITVGDFTADVVL